MRHTELSRLQSYLLQNLSCLQHSFSLFPYTTLFRSLDSGRDYFFGSTGSGAVGTPTLVGRGSAQLGTAAADQRSEEHTSELQSRPQLVCRLLLEQKKQAMKAAKPSVRAAII